MLINSCVCISLEGTEASNYFLILWHEWNLCSVTCNEAQQNLCNLYTSVLFPLLTRFGVVEDQFPSPDVQYQLWMTSRNIVIHMLTQQPPLQGLGTFNDLNHHQSFCSCKLFYTKR